MISRLGKVHTHTLRSDRTGMLLGLVTGFEALVGCCGIALTDGYSATVHAERCSDVSFQGHWLRVHRLTFPLLHATWLQHLYTECVTEAHVIWFQPCQSCPLSWEPYASELIISSRHHCPVTPLAPPLTSLATTDSAIITMRSFQLGVIALIAPSVLALPAASCTGQFRHYPPASSYCAASFPPSTYTTTVTTTASLSTVTATKSITYALKWMAKRVKC